MVLPCNGIQLMIDCEDCSIGSVAGRTLILSVVELEADFVTSKHGPEQVGKPLGKTLQELCLEQVQNHDFEPIGIQIINHSVREEMSNQ